MGRTVLVLVLVLPVLSCSGESRRAAVETLRSAGNPPTPPPDTVPEFLDYAADLQVNLSDMIKLPTGVLYRDIELGTGPDVVEGDSVVVEYQGWLPNGSLVDSALVGIRVGAGDALPGIDAALLGMKVGGIRKLVLSPGLAFGADGTYGVPSGSVLVYDLAVKSKVP